MLLHMANSSGALSQVPIRRVINNPQSQIVRSEHTTHSVRSLGESATLQEAKPTKKEAKKLRYAKLEGKPSWRAIKSIYWGIAVLLTIAEGGHTYAIAVTVGVNPLTAAATALCLYTGISLLLYFLFRRLSAYIAFGSL